MKKLFLLDAYALIYRAYYAFLKRPMLNAQGLNTSAVFGFTKTIFDLYKRESPTHIAVCFDPGGDTFRHIMFPEYKANRQETPEGVRVATPIIKEVVEAFNIPIIQAAGFEADDVIGTLAKKAEQQGFTTYMMTPDKDYGQLVSDNIFMFKPARWDIADEKVGPSQIRAHYGIERPEQVVDILALWGDTSDNVPGVPGVGEKNAARLVAQYGSVENIIAHAAEIKGKIGEAIAANVHVLERAKKLVTIDCNAPVDFDEELLRRKEPNRDALRELFTVLEFRSLMADIDGPATHPGGASQANAGAASAPAAALPMQGDLFGAPLPVKADATSTKLDRARDAAIAPDDSAAENAAPQPLATIAGVPHEYRVAQSLSEVGALCDMLQQQAEFCFDTETDGIDPISANVVGLSFAVKAHEAWFVPVSPRDSDYAAKVALLRAPLENPNIVKVGQNIKFDYLVLRRMDIRLRGQLRDTMLIHYLLEPDLRHNMDYLAETCLGYKTIHIDELIGDKKSGQITMAQVPLSRLADYAAEDADITWQLRETLLPRLDEKLRKLYDEIEAPLIYTLGDMEWEGVRIDSESLAAYGVQLGTELKQLEREICEMAGEPALNVFSPKQLGEVLFGKLKIASSIRTGKTKQYSTSEETLAALSDKHPIIPKILEIRGLKKLLSSYVETLPTLVNPRTQRIHTSFNQAVTSTGRLSSNNPNLQNIPIRDERGREIRKAFIASDADHVLLSADYSQVELRLMAHLSADPNLVEAFLHNEDVHASTAAKIFKVPLADVTREQRRRAKTANFGIIYGISAFGLAQRLNIPRSEARVLIDGYFETYPQVRTYMDESIEKVRACGYVETLCGRRRALPDIASHNAMVRSMAERFAINAPIQGSAADIIKIAMNNIRERLLREGSGARMLLQVHDELVFDVPKSELDVVKALVVHEMENAYPLRVPLLAEAGVGENWLEAH